jgi:hypothetical protein
LSLFTLVAEAQMSKAEVETMLNGVNIQEVKDVFLIRTREHDGATQGWFEKYEKLDPKSFKITYNDHSMMILGGTYTALIPYDKIKVIFVKKAEYVSIELID